MTAPLWIIWGRFLERYRLSARSQLLMETFEISGGDSAHVLKRRCQRSILNVPELKFSRMHWHTTGYKVPCGMYWQWNLDTVASVGSRGLEDRVCQLC